eukprot:m.79541 g.79541  ORF g.79541 m.79541 type:complete len:1113 (+) comp12571_c1_seq1:120-3458(+)
MPRPRGASKHLFDGCRRCDLRTLRNVLRTGSEHVDVNQADENGFTPLIYIAINNSEACVRELYNTGQLDFDRKDAYGDTALHHAVAQDSPVSAKVMLELGASPNCQNQDGNTPLHIAVMEDKLEFVAMLLQNSKTIVDLTNSDSLSPLGLAAYLGMDTPCRMLLRKKADAFASFGQERATPLHLAASQGNVGCAQLILSACHPSTAHQLLDVRDRHGRTPLHVAAVEAQAKVLDLLVRQGADLFALDKQGQTPLDAVVATDSVELLSVLMKVSNNVSLKVKTDADAETSDDTPQPQQQHVLVELLFLGACKRGKTNVVDALLRIRHFSCKDKAQAEDLGGEQDATPDKADTTDSQTSIELQSIETKPECLATASETGQATLTNGDEASLQLLLLLSDSAILEAFLDSLDQGHVDVLQLLLDSLSKQVPGKLNMLRSYRTQRRSTLLHLAVTSSSLDCLRLLVTSDICDATALDEDGRSPALLAASLSKLDMFEALKETFNPSESDARGRNILHYLALSPPSAAARFLEVYLRSGKPDRCQADIEGATPLHLAASKGHANTVAMLLETPAVVGPEMAEVKDDTTQRESTMLLIQEKGEVAVDVNVNVLDGKGRTPLHYAAYNGSQDCCMVLINARASVNVISKMQRTPMDDARSRCHALASHSIILHGGMTYHQVQEKREAILVAVCRIILAVKRHQARKPEASREAMESWCRSSYSTVFPTVRMRLFLNRWKQHTFWLRNLVKRGVVPSAVLQHSELCLPFSLRPQPYQARYNSSSQAVQQGSARMASMSSPQSCGTSVKSVSRNVQAPAQLSRATVASPSTRTASSRSVRHPRSRASRTSASKSRPISPLSPRSTHEILPPLRPPSVTDRDHETESAVLQSVMAMKRLENSLFEADKQRALYPTGSQPEKGVDTQPSTPPNDAMRLLAAQLNGKPSLHVDEHATRPGSSQTSLFKQQQASSQDQQATSLSRRVLDRQLQNQQRLVMSFKTRLQDLRSTMLASSEAAQPLGPNVDRDAEPEQYLERERAKAMRKQLQQALDEVFTWWSVSLSFELLFASTQASLAFVLLRLEYQPPSAKPLTQQLLCVHCYLYSFFACRCFCMLVGRHSRAV